MENLSGSAPFDGAADVLKGASDNTRSEAAHGRGVFHAWLALGPGVRTPWRPLRRDGDLIPCSMTIALLAYPPRIVTFLVLKWCPHSCLWSQCHGWVGWALYFFRNSTWEDKPGTTP